MSMARTGKLKKNDIVALSENMQICKPSSLILQLPKSCHQPHRKIFDAFYVCSVLDFKHSRTVKAGAEVLNSLNNGFDAIRPYLQKHKPIPEDLSISHEIPAAVSLMHSLENAYLMGHLAVKSIANLSMLEFILSDHPIAPYNIWMEKARHLCRRYGPRGQRSTDLRADRTPWF